jgi:hypothetical protein
VLRTPFSCHSREGGNPDICLPLACLCPAGLPAVGGFSLKQKGGTPSAASAISNLVLNFSLRLLTFDFFYVLFVLQSFNFLFFLRVFYIDLP